MPPRPPPGLALLFALALLPAAGVTRAEDPPRAPSATSPAAPPSAEAPASPASSAAGTGPTAHAAAATSQVKVAVGLYVTSIRGVDMKTRTFEADFYCWLRYPTLPPGSDVENFERLDFVNGHIDLFERYDQRQVGGETYSGWRVRGSFLFDPDLHAYPFDTQRLEIRIEHQDLEVTDLTFAPDDEFFTRNGQRMRRWGLGTGISVPEFHISGVTLTSDQVAYGTDFGDPEITSDSAYSRAVFAVIIKRDFLPYVFKILIPLAIILCLAYLVFFIPADALEVAAGLTVTSLLSCIAYQSSIASNMPEIGYLVASDRLFHLSYALVMLAMVETVWTFNLEKNGNVALSEKMESLCRWLFPALFVLGSIGIGLHALASAAP
jgi:branched-chain amino acid transport system substrate-binding protein